MIPVPGAVRLADELTLLQRADGNGMMHTDEVTIENAILRGIPVIRLSGSIHLENSPRVRNALRALVKRRSRALIVGLDGTRYVDASGLATFVECAQNMRSYGGRLAVVGLTAQVADAFAIAQLEGIFSVFSTEGEAVKHLASER